MGSEGSGKQISGLRNTKRIRGSHVWVRRQKDPKPNSHPEGREVYATGGWGEGGCAIPGEVCFPANGLASSRDDVMGEQKSAEGIVATAHGGEGLNVEGRDSTEPRWAREMQTRGLECLRTPEK